MVEIRSPRLRQHLRRIRALVLDVDGVLTDGAMYYGANGEAMKRFHTRDGMGIALLQKAGVRVAFITGERSECVMRRAEKLRVEDVYLGVEEKGRALEEFLRKHSLKADETAYVGDDVNDLPCLSKAGIAIAVADAVPEVLDAADLVTRRKGGDGAVREVAEAILAAR